jgi:YfiH family protein
MNLGRSTDDEEHNVDENRRRLLAALGAEEMRLARLHQVHGGEILDVDAGWREDGARPRADGLLTAERERLLVITVADCAPVFVVHEPSGACAAVHAGWRGTAMGIAAHAVGRVAERAGVKPRELRAGIGPAIGPCCYAVGDEVAAVLPDAVVRPAGARRAHADLWKANVDQLSAAGVPREHIDVAGLCTACRADLFFSHRRDHGVTGRMVALLGRRSAPPQTVAT